MLLTGTHPRTLDDKKRLVLPKKVRDTLGDISQVFVSPGPDQCLWVFPQEGLERLATKLDQTPATDAEARVFRRIFFAQMEAVDIDKTNRILIPDRLVELAGLKSDIVLIGVRDHLELWDAVRWAGYLGEHGPQFDTIAEKAFQK